MIHCVVFEHFLSLLSTISHDSSNCIVGCTWGSSQSGVLCMFSSNLWMRIGLMAAVLILLHCHLNGWRTVILSNVLEMKKKNLFSNFHRIAPNNHTPTRPLSYSRPLCMVNFCFDFIESDSCLEFGCAVGLFKQNSNKATANATNKPPIRMKNMPATLLRDNSLRVASCFSACLHSVLSNHHLFNSLVSSPFSSSDKTARLMGSL